MSALHINTPLLQSPVLSQRIGGRVWLKMDNLQPSGSFKNRGIGYACQQHQARGVKQLLSSSGGNAGLAVAYCGRMLKMAVTVVVPTSTKPRAIELIEQQGAKVIVIGEHWAQAHQHAMSLLDEQSAYIHPFDDPLLWHGHASLIDEVVQAGIKPDAVVLSVGGGGLLCGVVKGLKRHDLNDCEVLAVETTGAASLAAAIEAGSPVALAGITSIATSLGATQVSDKAYELYGQHPISSHVVSDKAAVDSCMRFLDDHRALVEPACGASLSIAYDLPQRLKDKQNILIIVCGGVTATLAQLQSWQQQL